MIATLIYALWPVSFAKVLDQEFVIDAEEVKSDWLDDILPGLVRLM